MIETGLIVQNKNNKENTINTIQSQCHSSSNKPNSIYITYYLKAAALLLPALERLERQQSTRQISTSNNPRE